MPYPILACSVVFFWIISFRAYLFTVLPTIAADLGLTPAAAGLLVGATSLAYCLVVWGTGFIPARRQRLILVGTLLSTLGMVGVAAAPSPFVLYVAAVVAGAAAGVYLPLGLALIVDASAPNRRSRYMGLHEMMATTGYFAGAGFVALALPALSWREATLAWTAVGFLAWVGVLFLRDESESRPAANTPGGLAVDATLLAAVVVFAVCQLLISGLISVLPLIMVEGWGVPQSEAAAVTSWSRLAGAAGIALAGGFGDRWRLAPATRAFFLLAAASTATMAVAPYGALFVGAVFVLAAAASGSIVLVSVLVAQAYPVRLRSRALGVSNGSAGVLALAVLPAVFGGFVDLGFPSAAFVVSAVASLLAAALIGLFSASGAKVNTPAREARQPDLS